jgi:hypothetical protein
MKRAKLEKPSQTVKPSQTKKNRAKPEKTEANKKNRFLFQNNRIEIDRFEPVSVRFQFF